VFGSDRGTPFLRIVSIRPLAPGFETDTAARRIGIDDDRGWPAGTDVVAYEVWHLDVDARDRTPWLAPADDRITAGSIVMNDEYGWNGSSGVVTFNTHGEPPAPPGPSVVLVNRFLPVPWWRRLLLR
jgi:hypothetical protein